MPGISGFLPLFKIGLVDKGQTIFISSAAGALGYNLNLNLSINTF
jgi:NADPH-dependent curcumin reductase CurA